VFQGIFWHVRVADGRLSPGHEHARLAAQIGDHTFRESGYYLFKIVP
jgi:hypothetical protein